VRISRPIPTPPNLEDPDYDDPRLQASIAAVREGHLEIAKAKAMAIVGDRPASALALTALSDISAVSKDWASCCQFAEAALRIRPDSTHARRTLARGLFNLGRPVDAAREAHIAVTYDPRDAGSYGLRVIALNRIATSEAYRALLETVIVARQCVVMPVTDRVSLDLFASQAMIKFGAPDAALRTYEQILAANGDSRLAPIARQQRDKVMLFKRKLVRQVPRQVREAHQELVEAALARPADAPPRVRTYEVRTPTTGRLALCHGPVTADADGGFAVEAGAIGLDLLVSTLKDSDNRIHGLRADGEDATSSTEFLAFPIPGLGVPPDVEFDGLVDALVAALNDGERLAVMCPTAAERSALVAVAVLSRFGHSLESAHAQVTANRGATLPISPAQWSWLGQWCQRARWRSPVG
jgi:protein-tyrosine phosphatase